jgi:hypothetical protein
VRGAIVPALERCTDDVRVVFEAEIGDGPILHAARPAGGAEQVRLPCRPLTNGSLKCADLGTGHFATLFDDIARGRVCCSPAVLD